MRSRVGAILISFLVLGVACTPAGRPPGRSFVVAGCEPTDFVPANENGCAGLLHLLLFSGLQGGDPIEDQPVNVVANSVTSTDQITWTIRLRDGWTFHNGEPVTAHSFVDAWNWSALQTNHAADNSTFSGIAGYEDLNPGEGERPTTTTMSGLKVLDRLTIQVKLLEPGNLYLSMWDLAPLPRAFFRDPDAWRKMPIGNGPYQMDGPWKPNVAIKLKRYPDYKGIPGLADRIEFRIYEGNDCFLDLERGLIDICDLQASDFHAAQREFRDHLVEYPSFEFNSIHFPMYDPRFRNKEFRQALSLAIDRAAITEEVYGGTATPATSLYPLSVLGRRNNVCSYCFVDVPLARRKLEASGWEGSLDLFADADPVMLRAAQAVAEEWRRNLGLDVAVHPLDHSKLLDRGSGRAHAGAFWDSTTLDDSPQTWLGMYQTGNEDLNWSGYSNREVDRLIAAGEAAQAPFATADTFEQRLPASAISEYFKAEDIVLEDMPVIPLWYPQNFTAYSRRLRVVTNQVYGDIILDRVQVLD
jgi:oligopeptide transport system substrate-binding protein